MSSRRDLVSAARICSFSASSSLPWVAIDSRTVWRRSSSSRRYRRRSSSRRSWASSSIPVTSLRYRAMNGTVDPSSSNATAARTWFSPTSSSPGIRCSIDCTTTSFPSTSNNPPTVLPRSGPISFPLPPPPPKPVPPPPVGNPQAPGRGTHTLPPPPGEHPVRASSRERSTPRDWTSRGESSYRESGGFEGGVFVDDLDLGLLLGGAHHGDGDGYCDGDDDGGDREGEVVAVGQGVQRRLGAGDGRGAGGGKRGQDGQPQRGADLAHRADQAGGQARVLGLDVRHRQPHQRREADAAADTQEDQHREYVD